MCPEDAEEVAAIGLKVYMCAIQNFSFSWMHPDAEGDQDRPDEDVLGIICKGDTFKVSPDDVKKAHKKHLRLLQNRNDFVNRTKTEYYQQRRGFKQEEPSFHPDTTRNGSRPDVPQDPAEFSDYLLNQGKEVEQRKEELRQLAEQKEQEEMAELNFVPAINKPRKSGQKAKTGDRCKALHEQAEKY